MDNPSHDPLPVGRAAIAKTFDSAWIIENKKTIIFSFLTLLIFSFCLVQFMDRFSGNAKSDYLTANKAIVTWMSDENVDLKNFKALEGSLKGHSELEGKFGAQIAQRLLAVGDVKKGSRYANAALVRADGLSSAYYKSFSQNTLKIAKGEFALALEEAMRLKLELEQDDLFWDKSISSGTVLYAYNLLRIASLQREMGAEAEELKTWQELVANAGWKGAFTNAKTYDPQAYSLLAQNFSEGDVSLLEYIEHRCNEIKSH